MAPRDGNACFGANCWLVFLGGSALAPPLLGGRLGPEFIILAAFFVVAALPFFDPTLLSLLSNLRLLFELLPPRNEVALPLAPLGTAKPLKVCISFGNPGKPAKANPAGNFSALFSACLLYTSPSPRD